MSSGFRPGTMVRLIQPELFEDESMYLVIGRTSEKLGGPACKILRCGTGEVFEWYEDVLVEVFKEA